jgi:hypothetical protein
MFKPPDQEPIPVDLCTRGNLRWHERPVIAATADLSTLSVLVMSARSNTEP